MRTFNASSVVNHARFGMIVFPRLLATFAIRLASFRYVRYLNPGSHGLLTTREIQHIIAKKVGLLSFNVIDLSSRTSTACQRSQDLLNIMVGRLSYMYGREGQKTLI